MCEVLIFDDVKVCNEIKYILVKKCIVSEGKFKNGIKRENSTEIVSVINRAYLT